MRERAACKFAYRRVRWLVASLLALAPVAWAAQQTQNTTSPQMIATDAEPVFEVATIKPSDPNSHRNGFQPVGSHPMIENETVRDLLAFACGVHSNQIVDAPAWLSTDHFDIDGVLDIPGQPNIQQMRGIVRKLLIERFNLKIHSGKREMSVYVITLAKGGSKMTKNTSDPNGLPKMNGNTNATERTIRFTNASMADIVLELTFDLDRPVVDQTGLQGRFDSLLKWKRDESLTDDPNAPPGFFTAIQEQLGLKVSPVKAPADVVLVDNVERPSSN